MADDLLALQRQIDGYSSSGEEDGEEDNHNEQQGSVTSEATGGSTSKDTTEDHEKGAPQYGGPSSGDRDSQKETENDKQPAREEDDDDAAFDLAAVVTQGRKERRERRKKLEQERKDRASGVLSAISLPCPGQSLMFYEVACQRRLLQPRCMCSSCGRAALSSTLAGSAHPRTPDGMRVGRTEAVCGFIFSM